MIKLRLNSKHISNVILSIDDQLSYDCLKSLKLDLYYGKFDDWIQDSRFLRGHSVLFSRKLRMDIEKFA